VQHYSRWKKLIRESLRINSDPLKHVLRRIIRQYPGVSFKGAKMTLDLPLYCVFHYFDELKSVMDKEEEGSDLKDRLKLLLDFAKEKFTEAFTVGKSLLDDNRITYELWVSLAHESLWHAY
jgi:hypothetical protein